MDCAVDVMHHVVPWINGSCTVALGKGDKLPRPPKYHPVAMVTTIVTPAKMITLKNDLS